MIRQPASFIAITLIAIILAGASVLAAATSGPANVVPMSEPPEAPGGPGLAKARVAAPPVQGVVASPSAIICTLQYTTTDTTLAGTSPTDPNTRQVGSIPDLSLVGDVGSSQGTAPVTEHWFRLDNAVVGATYVLQALPDYTNNYNLGIVVYGSGPSYTPILTDANAFDNTSASVTLMPTSSGPYFFKVFQITNACFGGTYRLSSSYTSPTATPSPTSTSTPQPWAQPDQFDTAPSYNDTLSNAAFLTQNNITGLTLYNAALYPADPGRDQDWFYIYVPQGYQCSVSAAPDTGYVYPYLFMELVAPDKVTRVGQVTSSDNPSISWTASSSGSYYIHIQRVPGSPTHGTYHLNWTAAVPTPTPIPLLDAYEPNETISAARPLNQSNVTGLTLFNPYLYPSDPGQDQDWYFIFANVPQVGSRYTVNAVSDNLCPVMDMDIRNPGTDLIGQALNSNTPSLSWIADRAGAYYIHIRRAANSVPCFGTYRLGWSVTKPTAEPPVSAFDVSGHSGPPPLAIWFTDQSSGVITEWLWNFGDGFTSTLRNPLHVYTASGVYTVALTVSGPGGSHTLTRSNYIHVYLPQPVFSAPVCGTTNKMTLMIGGVARYGLNITLYDNGVQLLTTSAATNNTFTFALSLGSGQHIFTATASNATETSLPSYPLALTISPTLAYDPVGVTFSYAPPTATLPAAPPLTMPTATPPAAPLATPTALPWGAITEHPRDSSGCANPNGWRVWVRSSYTTTVAVPVSYTQSAIVAVTLGNQTRVVADPMGTLHLPLTAVFTPPFSSGAFAITVTADGQTSIATGSAVMDSEGYVYDKNTWDSQGITQTLAGVTVTCQYSDTAANEWLMWQAWAYDNQVNPQATGADGYYSFFVSPGVYRITASHPDYWPYASPSIVVVDTPARLNIPLELTRRVYLPIILRNP